VPTLDVQAAARRAATAKLIAVRRPMRPNMAAV